MLMLTRPVGETVMIGYKIAVTVVGVNGNQVRFGIAAPSEVAVHRDEVYERIQAERLSQRVCSRPLGAQAEATRPRH